eukprot:CCRYP_002662-RA/>CCRYP_002662-RA protein AED:0.09 eAED:0.09 QI:75/1/1/1/0.5/0.33/3/659/66
MTKKSEEAHNLLWSHIVSIVGPKGIDVTGVMHDFEWALVNSIEKWFGVNITWDASFIGSRRSGITW